MKVMYVHGVGYHEEVEHVQNWVPAWNRAIEESTRHLGLDLRFCDPLGSDGYPDKSDPGVLYYEDIIRGFKPPDLLDYSKAVSSLIKSYFATRLGEIFGPRKRFLFTDEMRWKARQVVEWVENDALREALRQRVIQEIESKDPDIVIAHSYGGLITYDACLFGKPDLMSNRYYVTIGTQIGNALLRREFGGRQIAVQARHWFNLYNPGDPVFVCNLDHIRGDQFSNIVVDHEHGHDGVGYLGHSQTATHVWKPIAQGKSWINQTRSMRIFHRQKLRSATTRALLVGVDQYSDSSIPPLAGCVNDTYQLSEALQEKGFDYKNIRLLHNERATRENVMDGLEWLLSDAQPGDHRFFSFSGHGHQLASTDIHGEPDEMDEILVTYDYRYTHDSGLRDRDFQDLYANLDSRIHFLIFLDCCHSGGMTRGSGVRIRSFRGPADIEHTSQKWNPHIQMWEQAKLAGEKGLNSDFIAEEKDPEKSKTSLYYGMNQDLRRIGRATPLRDVPHGRYDEIVAKIRKLHPKENFYGPYLPIVFMACGEQEEASEYFHGSVSYGAFTYALVQALRDHKYMKKKKSLTYADLHQNAIQKLKLLNFQQNPEILGPSTQLKTKLPYG